MCLPVKKGVYRGLLNRVSGGELYMFYKMKGAFALPPSGNQDGDPHPDHHTTFI